MATFKAMVGCAKQDGTRPIYIRVTHKRVIRRVHTDVFADKSQVTPKGTIKDQRLIDMCEQIISRWRRKVIAIANRLDEMSVDDLVNYLIKKEENSTEIDFFAFADGVIAKMRKDGHDGNAQAYTNAVNSLRKFVGNSLEATAITADLLRRWLEHLASTTKGRAPSLYFASVRSIFNKMRLQYNDEDAGIVPIPNNPFARVKPPKAPQPEKRAITAKQVREIITMKSHTNTSLQKDHNDIVNLARDVFVLSFLLVGINLADLYELTAIQDGRITYQRKKTRNRRADHAEISIKVEPEAMMFINHYADDDRLLNFHKHYSSVNAFSAAVNKGLKVIGDAIGVPNLTYYSARHTWATIAVNECHIDKYTVHLALNHVDTATAITDIYIKKDWTLVDEANRKVIDYIANV